MNDKCCNTCDTEQCPFDRSDEYIVYPAWWNNDKDFCSRYSPLPDKPGKIEPIKKIDESSCYIRDDLFRALNLSRKINEIIEKIGPIIAAHNGREK